MNQAVVEAMQLGRYYAYPEYKDSGVELLGDIPIHWIVRRLKHTASIQSGIPKGKDLTDKTTISVPMLRVANVQDGYLNLDDIHKIDIEPHELERYSLRKGDVLMNEGGDNDKLGRGAVWQGDIEPCIHQNHVFAIRTENIEPEWLQQLMQSSYAKFYFYSVAKQSTNLASISSSNIKETPLLIPPKLERIKVLSFLDYATARIDRLIALQQRLIELLKEKRQAVISHAVTKGLNPDAPMKDSGVEWLGQVPAHWVVTALKRCWTVVDCKHITAEFIDGGIPLASIREVQSWEVDLSNAKQTSEEYYKALIEGGRIPENGDIIYSRNATVGEAARVTAEHPRFAMGQDVCLLKRVNQLIDTDFFMYQLKSKVISYQLDTLMVGSTFKRINVDDIRNFVVVVPPEDEAIAIRTYLNNFDRKYQNLEQSASRQVSLLQERRTALISAAVTGKIDLRGWTPPSDEEAA